MSSMNLVEFPEEQHFGCLCVRMFRDPDWDDQQAKEDGDIF